MSLTLEVFDPIYGQAEATIEESVPSALLPFVFYLHSNDGKTLKLQITDFHSNTWHVSKTPQLLEDLRDQVGIGGSSADFIQYLRDAFSSENVKVVLGGPASAIGGHGATSAKVVAQKCKGMPRVSLSLEKLEGASANDAMALISVALLKALKHQSNILEAEKRTVSQLKQVLVAAKEEINALQQQMGSPLNRSKKRGRSGATQVSDFKDTIVSSQTQANDVNELTQGSSIVPKPEEDTKPNTTGRVVPLRNKVHLAHAKRSKQRGSRLADDDE